MIEFVADRLRYKNGSSKPRCLCLNWQGCKGTYEKATPIIGDMEGIFVVSLMCRLYGLKKFIALPLFGFFLCVTVEHSTSIGPELLRILEKKFD